MFNRKFYDALSIAAAREEKRWAKKLRKLRKKELQAQNPQPAKKPKKKRPPRPSLFKTKEWAEARYSALKRAGGRCECCGRGPQQGAILNVDHIKPLSKFPDLALDPNNLQVLCGSCNRGKGTRDRTDWRRKRETADEPFDVRAAEEAAGLTIDWI